MYIPVPQDEELGSQQAPEPPVRSLKKDISMRRTLLQRTGEGAAIAATEQESEAAPYVAREMDDGASNYSASEAGDISAGQGLAGNGGSDHIGTAVAFVQIFCWFEFAQFFAQCLPRLHVLAELHALSIQPVPKFFKIIDIERSRCIYLQHCYRDTYFTVAPSLQLKIKQLRINMGLRSFWGEFCMVH